jgi:3D (Asp-Asp-Asp) domain-containing protein
VYYPTGNPTASGERIPATYRVGTHRWVAVSPDMIGKGYKLNTTIELCGISPELDGVYTIKDKTHRRMRNTVDILVRQNKYYNSWKALARRT